MKKILALIMALAMVFALCACGSTAAPAATEAKEEAAPAEEVVEAAVETEEAAEEPEGGFTEIPIWEDEELGNLMNVNGVYFQPVPMSNGNESIEGMAMHFEADVSAMENDLGYGVGDWVPYMTVDFEIIGSDGETAAEGTFMPMNADDGPHYGANIALPNADTYSITFTFHSPAENGYLVHSDAETGPGGLLEDVWGDGPLTLEVSGWDYIPQEW